jgi:hypothetical protein
MKRPAALLAEPGQGQMVHDITRDIVFKHISTAESFNSRTVFLCTTFNKFSKPERRNNHVH